MKMQKSHKKYDYDVAVIGAGPAGMMAAGKAAQLGLSVVLIEKNKTPGKKLLLTGGGRCNLTNAEFNFKKLVSNYNNGEFLFHAFSNFGPKETIEFFEGIGVKTKIENNKRIFPQSDDAKDVLDALIKYLSENNVKIIFNSEVVDFVKKGKQIGKIILKDGEIAAKNYILATGGRSYPLTGSTGFGYKLAETLGHTIIKPMPALSPIRLKEEWVKSLQGISLKNLKINVFQNNKKQISESGEILFTHFGITGPAVLNISAKVGELLEKGEAKIFIDLFPLMNQEEVLKEFEIMLKKYPNKSIKNILSDIVSERLAVILLDNVKISKEKIGNNMSKVEKDQIVKTLKNIEVTPENDFNFDQAHVTRGGISLKEINHKTMKSKIIDNLFFAGEIIDVDGKTGGFDLQMCWSTGYIAASSL
jgi:hypothetical protein